jgi:hypothetical protein
VLSVLIAAASEPSKVPWYIAGGVLAVYAVVLGAIGIRSASFPFGEWGARGVMLVSTALAAIAIAMAIVSG